MSWHNSYSRSVAGKALRVRIAKLEKEANAMIAAGAARFDAPKETRKKLTHLLNSIHAASERFSRNYERAWLTDG